MTALLDFPTTTASDLRDPFVVHTADAGHYDTRPASARVPFQISVQLPAHYLAVALYLDLGFWGVDALDTPETVREAVATCLLNSTFVQIEDTALDLAARAGRLDRDECESLEFCRRKVAEAFAPCDPWAVTGMPRPAPAPLAVIPYACDPS